MFAENIRTSDPIAISAENTYMSSVKMRESGNPKTGISIYQINLVLLEKALLLTALLLVLMFKYPLDFYLNEGGRVHHNRLESYYEHIALLCIMIGLISWWLAAFLLTSLSNWSYLCWNKRKIPYIQLADDAITFFGDARIPWSSIAYVRCIEQRYSRQSRPRRYLVLGLSSELQDNRGSIAHLDKLTQHSALVRKLYSAENHTALDNKEFFSVLLDGSNRLTFPSAEILTLIEIYWDAAIGVTERKIGDNFCEKISDAVLEKLNLMISTGKSGINILTSIHALSVFGVAMAFLAASFTPLFTDYSKESARKYWPFASGTIISSKLATDCRYSFEKWPDVEYKFSVNGTERIGSAIEVSDLGLESKTEFGPYLGNSKAFYRRYIVSPITGSQCELPFSASKTVKQYPVGTTVNVYFNPLSPEEAVLVKSSVSFLTWLKFFVVITIFFGICFVAMEYKRLAFDRKWS